MEHELWAPVAKYIAGMAQLMECTPERVVNVVIADRLASERAARAHFGDDLPYHAREFLDPVSNPDHLIAEMQQHKALALAAQDRRPVLAS